MCVASICQRSHNIYSMKLKQLDHVFLKNYYNLDYPYKIKQRNCCTFVNFANF